MKRSIQALFVPPVAVCRYGCAGCCAAPIAVFWIAGIVSIIYGFLGGPASLEGVSFGTLALGALLWGIAAIWAENVIKGVTDDQESDSCQKNKSSNVCRLVKPKIDETDPMEEVKKFQH